MTLLRKAFRVMTFFFVFVFLLRRRRLLLPPSLLRFSFQTTSHKWKEDYSLEYKRILRSETVNAAPKKYINNDSSQCLQISIISRLHNRGVYRIILLGICPKVGTYF